CLCFFFQAEDGIRDRNVTGVQTCALPISGEIMSIGRNFEESLMKGIRSLDIGTEELRLTSLIDLTNEELIIRLKEMNDERIFVIAELMRRGMSVEDLFEVTKIDRFFLVKLEAFIH